MAKDQSWIADLLIGYKTVQLNGVPLTRRNILNLLSGFTAVDNPNNPLGASTDLTAAGGGGFTAGGDLSGTASLQQVIGILNKALPALPGSNQYLHYTGAAWQFDVLPSSLPPNGAAGGDLNGNYPNPWVSAISGTGGTGSVIPVNGATTALNWITNAITLKQAGTTLFQLKALSTDFLNIGGPIVATGQGLIRVANNVVAFVARNAANTNNIQLLSSNGTNYVQLGEYAQAAGIILSAGPAGPVLFWDSATEYLRASLISSTATLTAAQTSLGLLITQTIQANGSNPNSLTIAPQVPGVGAASTATGTPGSLIVALGARVSTGVGAQLRVSDSGTVVAAMGDAPAAASGVGYLWLGPSATAPTTSNYTITSSNINTVINSPFTNIYFTIAGAYTGLTNGSGWQFGGSSPLFGGGSTVIGLLQVSVVPTSAPTNGIIAWANTGSPGSLGLFSTGIAFHRLAGAVQLNIDNPTTDVSANAFTIQAQNAWSSATTNVNGANLWLASGNAKSNGVTGLRGAVRIALSGAGSQVMVEATELAVNQRVVSLCQIGSGITSTQMPANTGDGVVYIANRTTAPTANAVTGGILYAEAGALKWRGSAGTITTLGAA